MKIQYLLFAILFALFPSCKKSVAPITVFAMDTVCTINAYDNGTKKVYDEIAARLSELENVFSVTIENTEIAKINKNAGIAPVKVGDDAIIVVKTALEIAEKTEGAFNPAAGKLIDLWGINTDYAKVPTDLEIKNALGLCDWKAIKIDEEKGEIFIEKTGVQMNLGGIAKGYAADCVVEILKKYEVKKAIVDLGGNVVVFGKKENGKAWVVGIKNPAAPENAPLLKLNIGGISGEGISVVTSGNYERFFEKDGRRYHHIFDTATGFPCENGTASSTIITKSSMIADALSTATFVMGNFVSISEIDDIFEIAIKENGEILTFEGERNSLYIDCF